MAAEESIQIKGLAEFQRALRRAEGANPRELTKALKEAGSILPARIRSGAPHGTTPHKGPKIASSVGNPSVSGSKARIPIRAPHAGVVGFSQRGSAAAALTARYGPPPRVGYKQVADSSDEIIRRIYKGIEDIVTAYGWFR